MRIISGTLKGKKIHAPSNLPVRPTTDFAKEGLFNILRNKFELSQVDILDLFTGTGNMSYEFASRGAKSIIAVDRNYNCVSFVKKMKRELAIKTIKPVKYDVFKFLNVCNVTFDLIFADPPYDLENFNEIAKLVFKNNLLNEGGLLIIEHSKHSSLKESDFFQEVKKYGNVNFSLFSKTI